MSFRLTREEMRAVESHAKVKVRKPMVKAWRAWEDTNLVGIVWFDQVVGKHELIDYVVAINWAGEVQQVEIIAYRENYGGQVRRRDWLNQFKGKTASAPVSVGADIHNITGATLSCRHITEGIKRVLAIFQQVRGRVVDAAPSGLQKHP